ncbi:MAG TPA: rhomboid family intramembrane serine protease [Thermoanaerobaculia bacterium]|nr:rhomboid family intramembrane serine protease [Thermoanaerobaculia bacterium]
MTDTTRKWISSRAAITLALAIVVCAFIPQRTLFPLAAATPRGAWWRLLTSQFLHVYIAHAMLNALAVLVLATQVERRVRAIGLLLVFFITGTIGQLVALRVVPNYPATGASNAALGLAGALLFSRASTWCPLAYLALQIALDLAFAGHVKSPHLASFAAGALLGISYRVSRGNARAAR